MSASTDTLERQLARDLERLGDRLADARLVTDLYDAVAGNALHPRDGEGRLAPSWTRTTDLLNGARETAGLPPLDAIPRTGREGDVSDRARETLSELGWELRPRQTGEQDPGHTDSPPDPPAHASEPAEWEREAHAEADAELRRRQGA
jgi:hypothetical protein